jgi:hypothetical protein
MEPLEFKNTSATDRDPLWAIVSTDETSSLNEIREAAPNNERNLDWLRQQLSSGGVIPFVGAGLSCAYGYPTWRAFLLQRAKECEELPAVEALLDGDDPDFEGAADLAHEKLGSGAFSDAIHYEFGNRTERIAELKGAVSLVPFLAQGPVITTNFDRVLENVYSLSGTGKRLTDYFWGPDPRMLNQAFAVGMRVLFKLHGDYKDGTTRVLTRADYDYYYGRMECEVGASGRRNHDGRTCSSPRRQTFRSGSRGSLPKFIESLIQHRPLLFLGCSLYGDRVLHVLDRAPKRDSNPFSHFAILFKEPGKSIVERNRFLADRFIRPIWLPEGRFDLLPLLLKHLIKTCCAPALPLEIADAIQRREWDTALELCSAAREDYFDMGFVQEMEGRVYFARSVAGLAAGRPELAVDDLTHLTRHREVAAKAYFLRGAARLLKDERESSLADLTKAYAVGYRGDELNVLLAINATVRTDFKATTKHLDLLPEKAAMHPAIDLLKAMCLIATLEFSGALVVLDRAVTTSGGDATYTEIRDALKNSKWYEKAAAALAVNLLVPLAWKVLRPLAVQTIKVVISDLRPNHIGQVIEVKPIQDGDRKARINGV